MGALWLFLIFLGVILWPSPMRADEKGPVIFVYSFLTPIQFIPLSSFYKTFTWLYIYKEGILIHVPFRPNQFLGWREITQVRSSLWGRTLILADDTGRIKARVYEDLKNSHHFIGWFMQERPDIWQPEEGLTFSKSSFISLFFLFGALFEFGLALFLGRVIDWGFWLMISFACLSILTVLLIPQSLTLRGDTLVLHYPFREKVINAHKIIDITAVYAPMGYIVLHLRGGEKIMLIFFSLGINLLFGFLWYWHVSWTRPNLKHGRQGPGGVHIPRRLTTLPLLHPPDD